MGDVAMTVPVLSSLAKQCNVEITVLTMKAFAPMFANIPNLTVFPLDKKGKHKGFFGLLRLRHQLKKFNFDAIADLHNVLRSQILKSMFVFDEAEFAVINKGRDEKRDLITFGPTKQLKSSTERYKEVFEELGFTFNIEFDSIFDQKPKLPEIFTEVFGEKKEKWVGIAPFAKHTGKIYPLEKMEKVVASLCLEPNIKLFLFGNGEEEMQILSSWTSKYKSAHTMPDGVRLPEELILMSHLDVMLSMDSANMHLASLVGTPVVSIWGATHPFAGFLGWKQSEENIVQIDLACRPCSIFGNVPCKRKDYACLNWIEPEAIVSRILKNLE